MRRALSPIVLLVLLFFVAPPGRAEEESPKRGALQPDQVARMVLLGSDAQQAFVAQYLESADRETLLAIQRAIRALAPKVAEEMRAAAAGRAASDPATAPGPVVTIQTRVLEVAADSDLMTALGAEPVPGTAFALLDDTQREAILRAAGKGAGVKQVTAPRITVFDRQRANVSVLNQISYIQDYDVEVGGNEEWIADPVVGIVQEGIMIDLRPVVSEDRRYVTLDLDVTWADLQRPMRERQLLLKTGAEPLTIQLPRIDIGAAHAAATLPAGGSALLASPSAFGNGNARVHRYVLVSADILDAEAAGVRKPAQEADEKRRGR